MNQAPCRAVANGIACTDPAAHLVDRDLTDTIITMDVLLTQRAFAQQLVDQHGYYLMIVKANQPHRRDDLALFFELPGIHADQEH